MNATLHPLCTQDPRVSAENHERSHKLYDLAHRVAQVVQIALQVLVICIFTKVVALSVPLALPGLGSLLVGAGASHFSQQAEACREAAIIERSVEAELVETLETEYPFLEARIKYCHTELEKAKEEARNRAEDGALHRTLLLKVVGLKERLAVLDAIRENPQNTETPVTRSYALGLIEVA